MRALLLLLHLATNWTTVLSFSTSIEKIKTRSLSSTIGNGFALHSTKGTITTEIDSDVNELRDILLNGRSRSFNDKTDDERQKITRIIERLEKAGSERQYLDDSAYIGDNNHEHGNTKNANVPTTLLWDSYELAYFDGSIDGGRSNNNRTQSSSKQKLTKKPPRIMSKIFGLIFGLRYSLQHAVYPNVFVNDVGIKIFGIPVSFVAAGNFTKISQDAVETIQNTTGTTLKLDTAVRIDFDKPLLWFGSRRFPIIFNMGAKAQSPPVTLCTTYIDDKIRLALAAKGGKLVFTRSGKAAENFAQDYKAILAKGPLPDFVLKVVVLSSLFAPPFFIRGTRLPFGIIGALVGALTIKVKVASRLRKRVEIKIET